MRLFRLTSAPCPCQPGFDAAPPSGNAKLRCLSPGLVRDEYPVRERLANGGMMTIMAQRTFLLVLMITASGARADADRAEGTFDSDGANRRFEELSTKLEEHGLPQMVGAAQWKDMVTDAKPGLTRCLDHACFAETVNRLFESTTISHFHYYTDDEWGYWHLRSAFGVGDGDREVEHIGVFPQRIDGRWFVRGVFESSPASKVDLRVGDELVEVNGEPFHPIRSFRGLAGGEARVSIARRPGVRSTLSIPVVKQSLHQAVQRAMRDSVRVVEHGPRRFAYLHAWTLLGDGGEYEALGKLQGEVDGLLLDFRDGFGGSPFDARSFLLGRKKGEVNPWVDDVPHWTKPVVILIADGARSAKEMVVYDVKKAGRAPLVGTPTPGDVTNVGAIRMVGSDAVVMLPGRKFALEDKPVYPDYLVPRDVPYAAGEDPQLDFAKILLAESVVPEASSAKSGASAEKVAPSRNASGR